MKKLLFSLILFFLFVPSTLAQGNSAIDTKQEFYKAEVLRILEQGKKEIGGTEGLYQNLEVKVNEGKGKVVNIAYGENSHINKDQLLKIGAEIIVSKSFFEGKSSYAVYDFYRLDSVYILIGIFVLLVLLVGGLRGFGSILGMLVSLLVILFFIVPNILGGKDPLTITIVGSIIILFTSTFLAHGVSVKTSIALVSTFASLLITATFAVFAVGFSNITGLGNEEFFTLQFGQTAIINIKGLFLSAIIIGTLGALNDITTSQAATVLELKEANEKLNPIELFRKGLNVGKEHIASLVNTLILAYAGSSFAVFIYLVLNPTNTPYWVILNNELVSDEIIMIVAGSVGLLLSVPIVTALAAFVFTKRSLLSKNR